MSREHCLVTLLGNALAKSFPNHPTMHICTNNESWPILNVSFVDGLNEEENKEEMCTFLYFLFLFFNLIGFSCLKLFVSFEGMTTFNSYQISLFQIL